MKELGAHWSTKLSPAPGWGGHTRCTSQQQPGIPKTVIKTKSRKSIFQRACVCLFDTDDTTWPQLSPCNPLYSTQSHWRCRSPCFSGCVLHFNRERLKSCVYERSSGRKHSVIIVVFGGGGVLTTRHTGEAACVIEAVQSLAGIIRPVHAFPTLHTGSCRHSGGKTQQTQTGI